MSSVVFIEKISPVRHVFDLCKRIVDAHLSRTVECVRLIINSFCWVDYLVILSCDRIHRRFFLCVQLLTYLFL